MVTPYDIWGEMIGPKVLGYLLTDREEDESVKQDEKGLSFEGTSGNQRVTFNIGIQQQEFRERVGNVINTGGGNAIMNYDEEGGEE